MFPLQYCLAACEATKGKTTYINIEIDLFEPCKNVLQFLNSIIYQLTQVFIKDTKKYSCFDSIFGYFRTMLYICSLYFSDCYYFTWTDESHMIPEMCFHFKTCDVLSEKSCKGCLTGISQKIGKINDLIYLVKKILKTSYLEVCSIFMFIFFPLIF